MMKMFKFSNTYSSSKVAENSAPSYSSAKNNIIIIMDTVIAVSILLFAIIIINLICAELLNVIIISALLIGIEKMLKKQTINFLPVTR